MTIELRKSMVLLAKGQGQWLSGQGQGEAGTRSLLWSLQLLVLYVYARVYVYVCVSGFISCKSVVCGLMDLITAVIGGVTPGNIS